MRFVFCPHGYIASMDRTKHWAVLEYAQNHPDQKAIKRDSTLAELVRCITEEHDGKDQKPR